MGAGSCGKRPPFSLSLMNIVINTRQHHQISDEALYTLARESYQQWINSGIQTKWLNRAFDEFRALLRNAVVFLAINTDDNKVVGMHCFYCFPKKHCANGFYLSVSPQMKRQGIATRMLQYEKEQFLKRGYQYLRCVTEVPATWSVKWHQKNGYRIVGYSKGKTPYSDVYSFRLQLAPLSWRNPATWLWNKPLAPVTACCYYIASRMLTKIIHRCDGELNWIGRVGKQLRQMTKIMI